MHTYVPVYTVHILPVRLKIIEVNSDNMATLSNEMPKQIANI